MGKYEICQWKGLDRRNINFNLLYLPNRTDVHYQKCTDVQPNQKETPTKEK